MTEQEKRDLISRYLSAYNSFDVEGMVEPLHPDIEFENVSGGEVDASASGIEAFRKMAEKATGLFASRRQTVTSFEVGEDGGISIRVAYEGTLAQDVSGGLSAGETISLEGRSEFRFKDGKIARIVDHS
jgi:ketosteroid isomerase-like protein